MSLFLTPADLQEWTDYKYPAHQIKWLRKNGICHTVGRSGRPKVLKSELERIQHGSVTSRDKLQTLMASMGRQRKTDKHLPRRMYQKGPSYYYLTKQNKWLNLGREYPAALAKWAEIEGSSGKNTGLFQSIIDRYTLANLPKLAPKTRDDRERILKKLGAVFGNMPTEQIKPIHIRQYLDQRSAKIAANREIAVLSTLFNQATNWGWTERNPTRGIDRHTEKPRDRYITDTELQALINAADATYQAMIKIAYLTAMRRGDILDLKLADITEAGIYVRQNKTGQRQLFTWTPKLKAAVKQAKQARKTRNITYLFTNRHAQQISITGFNSAWRRLRDKTGIKNIHFHDIRAKSITDAKQKRGLEYAQALGGHQNQSQTEGYIKAKEITQTAPLE